MRVAHAALMMGRFVLRALATIAALAGACAVHGAPLVVSAACRDGVVNGAYELRDADGGLRVAGAFAKGHRTGTFIFWDARGARVAVIPYDNDAKVGTVALWYTTRDARTGGTRKLEAPHTAGERHGVTRSWYDNGRPRAELRYERGVLAEARAWRRNGSAMAESDARALAERDAASAAALFRELESTVDAHLPACEASAPRGALTLRGQLG